MILGGRERILILGNGVAGNTALEAIRRRGSSSDVVMVSEEPYPEYSACILPYYVSGDLPRRRVFLKSLKDYGNIKIRFGEKVREIDPRKSRLILEKGSLSYDKLVLAMGGEPIMADMEGGQGRFIYPLKTLAHADRLARSAAKRVTVIGSGLIGVEAAVALRKRGHRVSLISRRWVLPRILDEEVGRRAQSILERNGVKVIIGETVREIFFKGRGIKAVRTDRQEVPCDLIVMAIGLKPRVGLAAEAGIDIGPLGGIKVNERMETSLPRIYACGDCAEPVDRTTGETVLQLRWFNARQMGWVAGLNCIGGRSAYGMTQVGLVMNLFGIAVGSVGQLSQQLKGKEVEILEEGSGDVYIRFLMVEGTLVGAQFIGNTEEAGIVFTAIQNRFSFKRLSEGFVPFPWYHKLDRYIQRPTSLQMERKGWITSRRYFKPLGSS